MDDFYFEEETNETTDTDDGTLISKDIEEGCANGYLDAVFGDDG